MGIEARRWRSLWSLEIMKECPQGTGALYGVA